MCWHTYQKGLLMLSTGCLASLTMNRSNAARRVSRKMGSYLLRSILCLGGIGCTGMMARTQERKAISAPQASKAVQTTSLALGRWRRVLRMCMRPWCTNKQRNHTMSWQHRRPSTGSK